MHQRALLAKAVLVVAHAYNYHLGVRLEACRVLVGVRPVRQNEELQRRIYCGYQRNGVVREYGIYAFSVLQLGVSVEIHDILLSWQPPVGQRTARVHIVGTHVCTGVQRRGVASAEHCGNDNGHVPAADVHHRHGITPLRAQPVEAWRLSSGYHSMACTGRNVVYQMACHWNFCLGLLAQRYPDGVAYAVGQQRANARRALYPAVFTLTGLGHPEVKGIVHVFLLHLAYEQTDRPHHHDSIARLD